MTAPSVEFYRLDPLTGCYNFLSFVETLEGRSAENGQKPFSLLYGDINFLHHLNDTRGHVHGDSVIRWLGIVLQEECSLPTYRIGGDEFVVILTDGLLADYEDLLHRIFARVKTEGEQLGLPSPAASIALIHYHESSQFTFNDVMFQLGETMLDVKRNKGRGIRVYQSQNLIRSTARADDQSPASIEYSWEVLQSIANDTLHRLVVMGQVLDVAQKNSYLDSISGLPNLRAAMAQLEKAIASSQPFAMLLIDGDDLRLFNSINYAAGDEAIQNMGSVLSEHLRPGDFIARWRAGDEFVVILPDTPTEGAKVVGERFCAALREASKAWKFQTSVSIGIALFPQHGKQVSALIDAAEMANKQAKEAGKNQVVVATIQ